MFRKTMIALFAVASIGMLAPDVALARGGGRVVAMAAGGHGGGFGGGHVGGFGGGHGGFGGGSFHTGGFGGSFARSTAIGAAGVARWALVQQDSRRPLCRRFPPRRFPPWLPPWTKVLCRRLLGSRLLRRLLHYPYYIADDFYYDDGGCYVVRRRVHTRHGWRIQPVQVCG